MYVYQVFIIVKAFFALYILRIHQVEHKIQFSEKLLNLKSAYHIRTAQLILLVSAYRCVFWKIHLDSRFLCSSIEGCILDVSFISAPLSQSIENHSLILYLYWSIIIMMDILSLYVPSHYSMLHLPYLLDHIWAFFVLTTDFHLS